MAKIRLASSCSVDSAVDGPGLRTVIWTQGCPHNCKGCHNPHTHSYDKGIWVDTSEIIDLLRKVKLQQGITLSGGEPFEQPQALLEIVVEAKKLGLNVWAFSGYTYEQLMKDEYKKALLTEIDVLVDGRFVEELKDYRLRFKGSKNQRIIDVQTSIQENKIIRSKYDEENQKL